MADTLLSVLVPVYNVQDYVEECLLSLLRQNVDGLEVVVINDGSTDASRDIVGRVCEGDPRVVIVDKPNSGYGASLNQGLACAHGTYVGFLESDDTLYAGALRLLLEAARANDADVAKGDFMYWWPTDAKRSHVAREISPELCVGVVDTTRDMRIYSRRSTIWSGIYRAQLLEDNDIRFLETPGAAYQDTSFNFKVFASSHRTVFVDAPIVHYRQDNAMSSINSKDKADAVCGEFDEIDTWLQQTYGDSADELLATSLLQRYNAYLWNLDRLSETAGIEFLAQMGREFAAFEETGRLDVSTWDGWRLTNLRALQDDPKRYLRIRNKYRGDSSVAKAKFALALGGPQALASALSERSGRQ